MLNSFTYLEYDLCSARVLTDESLNSWQYSSNIGVKFCTQGAQPLLTCWSLLGFNQRLKPAVSRYCMAIWMKLVTYVTEIKYTTLNTAAHYFWLFQNIKSLQHSVTEAKTNVLHSCFSLNQVASASFGKRRHLIMENFCKLLSAMGGYQRI